MKSVIVTSVQFLSLGWMLARNPWIAPDLLLVIVQVFGALLGLWAILKMMQSKLNVAPDVRKGASLITSGPYRVLRHPMYTSLILVLFPLVIAYPDTINLVVFVLLTINMLVKLRHEERLLKNAFPDYESEMKGRWRLIPWIY